MTNKELFFNSYENLLTVLENMKAWGIEAGYLPADEDIKDGLSFVSHKEAVLFLKSKGYSKINDNTYVNEGHPIYYTIEYDKEKASRCEKSFILRLSSIKH